MRIHLEFLIFFWKKKGRKVKRASEINSGFHIIVQYGPGLSILARMRCCQCIERKPVRLDPKVSPGTQESTKHASKICPSFSSSKTHTQVSGLGDNREKLITHAKLTQKASENIYHTGHTAPTRHTPTSSSAATSHHLHLLQQHHLGASYCLFSF